MDRLLTLLQQNARISTKQLAVMLETTEQEVIEQIEKYEADGIIKGYTAVINREKADKNYVAAIIELKVTPKTDFGFDEIAKKITEYDEVESVYLMSGGYDLAVIVTGQNFKDIAMFVAKRLSLLDSVVSTATHFLLTRYKDRGIIMSNEEKDERSILF